jgi:hypothetical protein
MFSIDSNVDLPCRSVVATVSVPRQGKVAHASNGLPGREYPPIPQDSWCCAKVLQICLIYLLSGKTLWFVKVAGNLCSNEAFFFFIYMSCFCPISKWAINALLPAYGGPCDAMLLQAFTTHLIAAY